MFSPPLTQYGRTHVDMPWVLSSMCISRVRTIIIIPRAVRDLRLQGFMWPNCASSVHRTPALLGSAFGLLCVCIRVTHTICLLLLRVYRLRRTKHKLLRGNDRTSRPTSHQR
jgi:hypothetical protein